VVQPALATNEFGGLEFGRLTYPGRDRQQLGDKLCRISAGEKPRPAERNYSFGCLAAFSAQRPKAAVGKAGQSPCRSRRRDCPDDRLAPASSSSNF
jgi:hypothetical protein